MRYIIVATLLGVSCAKSIREPVIISPKGYEVEIRDRGSFSHGILTRAQVLEWLDARIAEWIALRSRDYDVNLITKMAKNINYLVIDDYRFPESNSPTGFAAGLSLPGSIAACVYSRAVSDSKPTSTPDWIVRQNPTTGKYSYGVILPDGGLQVLGHELDHQIGIHHELVTPPD